MCVITYKICLQMACFQISPNFFKLLNVTCQYWNSSRKLRFETCPLLISWVFRSVLNVLHAFMIKFCSFIALKLRSNVQNRPIFRNFSGGLARNPQGAQDARGTSDWSMVQGRCTSDWSITMNRVGRGITLSESRGVSRPARVCRPA